MNSNIWKSTNDVAVLLFPLVSVTMVEMLEQKCLFKSFAIFEARIRARSADENDTL